MAISVPVADGRPTRVRQPDVPADHDRADPAGRGRGRRPPDRLDRRGERFAVGAPVVLGTVVFFVALAAGRLDTAISLGSLAVTPLLLAFALGVGSVVVVGPVRARRTVGLRAAGPATRRRTIRSACSSPPAPPPRAGCGPGWLLGLPVVWMVVCLVAAADGRLRRLVHPVGAHGQPADRRGLAAGPHRPDAARPAPADVRLPQQPDRGAPGVVAVVGLAVQPEARLVLPGGPRRRDVGRALRRRQPRHLVARRPGHRLRRVDGVQAPEPGAGAHRDRLRGPVDPVGAHRPGRLPVPLLHGPAVRRAGPRLLRRGAVARRVAPRMGAGPRRGGDRDHRARRCCGSSTGRCARSSASNRSTRGRRPARRSSPTSS